MAPDGTLRRALADLREVLLALREMSLESAEPGDHVPVERVITMRWNG